MFLEVRGTRNIAEGDVIDEAWIYMRFTAVGRMMSILWKHLRKVIDIEPLRK